MRIHFIAIGGSAMHNLAITLSDMGHQVTGSDDLFFEPSKSRLKQKGLLPKEMGWNSKNITPDLDFVILGMHAKSDNPELLQAQKLALKIYSYPEYLYEHSKNKTRVVIAGSHGKTTITAMVLHVLSYHNREVDFMVGAKLKGFDTMVNLTDTNDFIILEGDEYLTSTLDKRPKIHWYKPNIALISGIAWDHVNVFPSLENYVEQFDIFIQTIVDGGVLVYNEEDETVCSLVKTSNNPIRKQAYHALKSEIINAKTYIETPLGKMPLHIFGKHNLSNLSGAKWICQHIGVDEEDFYDAIASFEGASMRLEKISETLDSITYRDFAHSPSKVLATTEALKSQYPDRTLIACLELYTFSSLDINFLAQYKNTLKSADIAIVFYDKQTLSQKNKLLISEREIQRLFNREDLTVLTQVSDLESFIKNKKIPHTNLLLMSSGNFRGMKIKSL